MKLEQKEEEKEECGADVVTGQLTEMAEAIIRNLWQQQKWFK